MAGGVHRQRIAAARKVNIADDVGMGDDIHRSTVQQLHTVGSDGHVDPAPGGALCVTDSFFSRIQRSPGHLDVQPGFVLHGQDVGVDAHDGVAIEVAPAVIHVDVHGGAAGEPGLRAVFHGHISGVDAVYKFAVGNGSIAAAVKVDVQRTAAVNFHTAAALGADGACIHMGAGALQVQGQRLAGADVQIDTFSVVKQQAVVAADGSVILHIDIGVEFFINMIQLDARTVEVPLQVQVCAAHTRHIVAGCFEFLGIKLGNSFHLCAGRALGDIIVAS